MSARRFLYLTGTRADYSPMRSTLIRLAGDSEISLGLIVTGMHLCEKYGNTVRLIEKDGLPIIARPPMLSEGDRPETMVKALACLIDSLVDVLRDEKPDALLVTGDRGEALAGAVCGAHLSIPVVHFCGGSSSGSIDDSIRHAVTRFAHVHFPATRESYDNLIRMGENPASCFLVGLPGADLRVEAVLTREQLQRSLGFDLAPQYLVVLQHPVTSEFEQAGDQMRETLKAVEETGLQVVIMVPNSDSGGQAMEAVSREMASHNDKMRVVSNLPRPEFASLLRDCSALVGNSSCGLGEAVSLGIPVVNIGTRQNDRERMGNTLDVGYERDEIAKAIAAALSSPEYRSRLAHCGNEYMKTGTEETVLRILKTIDLNSLVPRKPLWPKDSPALGGKE